MKSSSPSIAFISCQNCVYLKNALDCLFAKQRNQMRNSTVLNIGWAKFITHKLWTFDIKNKCDYFDELFFFLKVMWYLYFNVWKAGIVLVCFVSKLISAFSWSKIKRTEYQAFHIYLKFMTSCDPFSISWSYISLW